MNREDAFGLMETARVARLATVTPEGGPHLIPIVFALDRDELVTAVDHKPKRTRDLRRLENIRAKPRVSVLIDHYTDDWDDLWWVRIDGPARVVESGDGFESALDALVEKYEQYSDRRPEGPVIRLAMERVVGWRAGQGSIISGAAGS